MSTYHRDIRRAERARLLLLARRANPQARGLTETETMEDMVHSKGSDMLRESMSGAK